LLAAHLRRGEWEEEHFWAEEARELMHEYSVYNSDMIRMPSKGANAWVREALATKEVGRYHHVEKLLKENLDIISKNSHLGKELRALKLTRMAGIVRMDVPEWRG